MRIVCVGGGPAGLYFAIRAKLRDAGHRVTVLERDPPGATHGWGVVYWEPLLDVLFRADPVSARAVQAASTLWRGQRVVVGASRAVGAERTAYLPGYGYSIQRATLLSLLAHRAVELGVDVRYRHPVASGDALADLAACSDLVVAADGAHSQLRRLAGTDAFGTRIDVGANRFIWLGTDRRFETFVFAFERTKGGWIWFHAYPSAADVSTCIVECAPRTWTGLGLDRMAVADGCRLLERIFAGPLDGHRLLGDCEGRPAYWQRFRHVTNSTWRHENLVLLGDAAHTTHFTLGSGTALAMIDAIMLDRFLRERPDLATALRDFDRAGHAALDPLQERARASMAWFEGVDDRLDDATVLRTGQRPQPSSLPPGTLPADNLRPDISGSDSGKSDTRGSGTLAAQLLAADPGVPDPVAFAFAMATRHGDESPLRYQLLRAAQLPAIRALEAQAGRGSRWLHEKGRALVAR